MIPTVDTCLPGLVTRVTLFVSSFWMARRLNLFVRYRRRGAIFGTPRIINELKPEVVTSLQKNFLVNPLSAGNSAFQDDHSPRGWGIGKKSKRKRQASRTLFMGILGIKGDMKTLPGFPCCPFFPLRYTENVSSQSWLKHCWQPAFAEIVGPIFRGLNGYPGMTCSDFRRSLTRMKPLWVPGDTFVRTAPVPLHL